MDWLLRKVEHWRLPDRFTASKLWVNGTPHAAVHDSKENRATRLPWLDGIQGRENLAFANAKVVRLLNAIDALERHRRKLRWLLVAAVAVAVAGWLK